MKREKLKSNILNTISMIGDIGLINLGFYMTFLALFDFEPRPENIAAYYNIIPIISVTTVIIFDIYGLYKTLRKSIFEVIYSLVLSVAFIALVTTAAAFFFRGFAFPRSVLLVTPIIQFLILVVWRVIIWKINRYSHGIKRILIIGDDEEGKKIAKKVFTSSKELYKISYTNLKENLKYLLLLIEDSDEVIICPFFDEAKKSSILSYCIDKKKELYLVPNLYDILLSKSKVTQFDDTPVFQVSSLELRVEQKFIKRLFDICVSVICLIIGLPVMVLVAIAIKFDSRGSIFYLQERVTRAGKVFKIIKFRTMRSDAEKYSGPVLATKSDSRITRVGKFIRATRLDEIPQLINVLLGDMSIVGPRPERSHFIEQFVNEIPEYYYRHTVKAGITGIAQVQGKYTTSAADKLRYDLMYIRDYSFLLDLRIIFQTIKIMFIKENSNGVDNDNIFEDMAKEINYKAYSEIGVTRMDERL